jgi:hypothetical protein
MARTAKQMQNVTIAPPPAQEEARIRVTLRTSIGFEYHEVYPASVVRDILDPDVDDAFIQITLPADIKSVKVRYLHTSGIAEIDLHDELLAAEAEKPVVEKRKMGG